MKLNTEFFLSYPSAVQKYRKSIGTMFLNKCSVSNLQQNLLKTCKIENHTVVNNNPINFYSLSVKTEI